jgi:hypothetical protein
MVEANQKESEGEVRGSGRRSPSFQSLLAEGNRLSLQLNPKNQLNSRQDVDPDEIHSAEKLQNQEESLRAHEEDKAIRKKFENILVDEGILSPTNNFSTFSADFKKFKILLETPPICGVSYQELRQCLAAVEKIRTNLTPAVSPTYINPHQSESKGNMTKGYFCNAAYFESIFETTFKFAIEVLDSVTRIRTKMGVDIVKSICTREADITARKRWWAITQQLGHPKAPWHFQEFYPKYACLNIFTFIVGFKYLWTNVYL